MCGPPLGGSFHFWGSTLLSQTWPFDSAYEAVSIQAAAFRATAQRRSSCAQMARSSNTHRSLKILQGRQLREDGLVVCVLAGAGEVTRVVQHFPALVIVLLSHEAAHPEAGRGHRKRLAVQHMRPGDVLRRE